MLQLYFDAEYVNAVRLLTMLDASRVQEIEETIRRLNEKSQGGIQDLERVVSLIEFRQKALFTQQGN